MGKRSVLFVGILGFAAGCIWLVHMVQPQSVEEKPVQIILADETARTEFLQEHGLTEYVCIATETIRLPASVDANYQEYATLQEAQNLPLTEHLGDTAVRYTYVQNDSGQDSLRTELLIDGNQVLIGAVQYDLISLELEQLLTVS